MKLAKKIPDAKIETLDNGIRVVIEELPHLRSVSVGLVVGAGAVCEEKRNMGISHFIEHMMFKGTEKRSAFEIARELDSIGGKLNAFTGKEYTVYYAVVEDRHFKVATDVLSDMFLNSLFKEEEIDLERNVVLEEIKMYEDTPDEQIHDVFASTILQDHSLGNTILGSEITVGGIKRKDIKEYLQKAYTPENLIISVAGNIKKAEAIKFFNKTFKDLSGKSEIKIPPVPEIKKNIRLKSKKTEQVHLIIGSKGVAQTDEERYTFTLLDNILGGSMSSRLFQEIREKRALAYSIYSFNQGFKGAGIFNIYAGTRKENFEQVIELITQEMAKIKRDGITKDEMERAKEFVKGSMVLGLESSNNRMNYIAKSLFYYDRIIPIDEIFEKIDLVKAEDIVTIANKLFVDKYMNLAVIGDFEELPIKEIRI